MLWVVWFMQDGLFLLYVSFPADYPFRAPEIRFLTPLVRQLFVDLEPRLCWYGIIACEVPGCLSQYHCNVNSIGRICHPYFDRDYTSSMDMKLLLSVVYGLLQVRLALFIGEGEGEREGECR
jgi:ubiquitin-protein ligase